MTRQLLVNKRKDLEVTFSMWPTLCNLIFCDGKMTLKMSPKVTPKMSPKVTPKMSLKDKSSEKFGEKWR